MPLTTGELKSRLWGAADILRGQIDSSDYKNYIFSMLFLKRVSDRFQEEVEKGRKRIVEKAAAGAGANTQKRIRDELNYLIDHYTPSNDNKIEVLIDKWRRSGDPAYDPMIKIRYRNARKKKSGDDYAF